MYEEPTRYECECIEARRCLPGVGEPLETVAPRTARCAAASGALHQCRRVLLLPGCNPSPAVSTLHLQPCVGKVPSWVTVRGVLLHLGAPTGWYRCARQPTPQRPFRCWLQPARTHCGCDNGDCAAAGPSQAERRTQAAASRFCASRGTCRRSDCAWSLPVLKNATRTALQ